MIEIIGTLDPAVSEVEPLRKAHPQIKMLVLEGATHGGEQGCCGEPRRSTRSASSGRARADAILPDPRRNS
jgi:hypothetical protein